MKKYNLPELLKLVKSRSDLRTDLDQISKRVKQTIQIEKPGFICVMDLRKKDPFIFIKNINLEFPKESNEHYLDILKQICSNQKGIIYRSDKMLVDFSLDHPEHVASMMKMTFKLRFPTCLMEEKPRTYIRNSTVLSIDSDNRVQIVLLTVTDVTPVHGFRQTPVFHIRCETKLHQDLIDFEKKVNNQFRQRLVCTKREREVLQLIAEGKTSQDISEILFISVKTVNKHRQNLLKKNKVSNTTSLIKLL